jgi:Glyoxalase-like domain
MQARRQCDVDTHKSDGENRLHLDVRSADCSHEAEVERLIGLGARRAGVALIP